MGAVPQDKFSQLHGRDVPAISTMRSATSNTLAALTPFLQERSVTLVTDPTDE